MVQSGGGSAPVKPVGFAFTYGYIEARVKIPTGKSLWPAIWLWPANHKDPPEIDIMEIVADVPNKVHMTFHHPDGTESQGIWIGPDFSDGFHTFAVDWLPDALVWYVDGVERYRWNGATPKQQMYPILNLAIGGNWAGPPDDKTAFPADYLVDYIRIYEP
jgi:beta-glucanase (GH16 family)